MSNCTISYHVPGCDCEGRILATPTKKKRAPKARRQTERDLKRLDDQVEKIMIAIGGRFGDVDNTLVGMADELLREVRRWAAELREYMDDREADGARWEL